MQGVTCKLRIPLNSLEEKSLLGRFFSEAGYFSWQSWFQLVFLPVQRFSCKEMETLAHDCKELTSANSLDEPGSRFHVDFSGGNSPQQTPWLLFHDILNREPRHILPHFWPSKLWVNRFCLSHCIYSNLLHYNRKIIIHYVRNNMVWSLFINRVLIWEVFPKILPMDLECFPQRKMFN